MKAALLRWAGATLYCAPSWGWGRGRGWGGVKPGSCQAPGTGGQGDGSHRAIFPYQHFNILASYWDPALISLAILWLPVIDGPLNIVKWLILSHQ